MFEIVVEAILYIKDVPVELTLKALESGELRRGSVVGLSARPVVDPGKTVSVEVVLGDDRQAELVKPGLTLPVEEGSGALRLSGDWESYLLRDRSSASGGVEVDFGGCRRRPTPQAL